MKNLRQSIWVELFKARRSKVPFLTALAFSLVPFIGGFFMIVLKDPELARRVGIISAKATIMAGTADWPTLLDLLAQAAALGGIILFSFVASWIFGREFSDRTAKDLLALPTPRHEVVIAKFVVIGLWTEGLTLMVLVLGLGVGTLVGLPPVSVTVLTNGVRTFAVAATMTIALMTPIAFAGSAGRGYLPPMGAAMLALLLAQIVAAAGWGEYFPWSIPALYAGMAGPEFAALRPISYVIVFVTSLGGIAATLAWWQRADHTQ